MRLIKTSLLIGGVILLSFFNLNVNAHSPTVFIPNQGQWDGPFQFKSEFSGLSVFAENYGFTYVLSESFDYTHEGDNAHVMPEYVNKHAFRLRFNNSNQINFNGEHQKSGYYNYLIGNDRSKWKGHVPIFEEVFAADIYDGIDIRAYGESTSFKYDFIVNPNANAALISFNYSGADEIQFDNERLIIKTSVGDLYESIPVSYQIINGVKSEVECRYVMKESGFGFEFPMGYNVNYPLVIDPVLVAATLSGTTGSAANFGHGATFDLAGNVYSHAISFNSQYPTDEGSFQEIYGGGNTDAAISKLTPDGTELIYATFLGGNQGEYPHSTIVNGNEEIYVFGITASSDFPTSLSAFQSEYGGGGDDIFITGLSADGSELVGSTYLGGASTDGRNSLQGGYDNFRGEINVNLLGEVFIASCSSSEDYPTTDGSAQPDKKAGQDGVITKLNHNLSEIVWSTFIGSEVDDMAYGIRIREDQSVLVSGAVGGNNLGGNGAGFVTTPGAFQEIFGGGTNDGFITELSSDGANIVHSTFLGLSGTDKCYFMDIDNEDDVWVYMDSGSNWTVTEGVWGDGGGNLLVHKLSADLSTLLITSYLTDQPNSQGTPVAFMVDLCNGVYISAYGTGSGFEASDDAIFSSGGFYIGAFTPDMSGLEYGTYYTGNHVDGGTSRFDKQGIVYQGVCSCGVFNTTDDAWADSQSSFCDIGVFKIDFEIESVNAVAGAAGQLTGCAPHTVAFDNFSSGEEFSWFFGDGGTSDEFEPEYLYDEAGEYLVTLVVYDPESCNVRDTAYIPITVYPEVNFIADFSYELDCETGFINIIDLSEGPADIEYEWDMGDGTILTETDPSHLYDAPGEYTVTLYLRSDACNQEMTSVQVVIYIPEVVAEFEAVVLDICESFLVGVFNQSLGVAEYIWNMGDGVIINDSESFEYEYINPGTYEIILITNNPGSCNLADTISQSITFDAPPILTPEISITQAGFCEDLKFTASVDVGGAFSSITWTIDQEVVGTDQYIEGVVSDPGNQSIVVVVTDPICEHEFTDIVEFPFYEYLGFDLPYLEYLCYYEESLLLDATVPFEDATYQWLPGGSTEPQLVIVTGDDYEVTVGYNGCIEVQNTLVNPGIELALGFEEEICAGNPNTIVFPDESGLIEELDWEDGQSGFIIEVSEPGYYPFLAVDVFGCDQVDSLYTFPRDDDPNIEIPNVFTPNGDGFNDVFQIEGEDLVSFELQIFDRWGTMVFSTDDLYGTWDGVLDGSGKDSGSDTFMYILNYRDYCDLKTQTRSGNLKVLR